MDGRAGSRTGLGATPPVGGLAWAAPIGGQVPARTGPELRRLHVRTFLVPSLSALVLSGVATYLEVRTVGRVWDACEVGSSGGRGFALLFFHLPLLWAGQTVLIGAPAPLLALLSWRRPVVLLAMVGFAAAVLATVAWVYFARQGLPINDGYFCARTEPGWWPGWLPPKPAPYHGGNLI